MCVKNIIASANMHLIKQYRILQISPVGSSDVVTFFDTSRCRFAKFSHLLRTFHTSLSFVAYDSTEFHLTGSYGRDVAHVKEIPSLFLSAWKVPHATCLCARDAKFFGEHIRKLGTRALAWWNDIAYADFWMPNFMKNPHQKATSIQIDLPHISRMRFIDYMTLPHPAFNVKYGCLILISCRHYICFLCTKETKETMHSIYVELLFLSHRRNIVRSSNLFFRIVFL